MGIHPTVALTVSFFLAFAVASAQAQEDVADAVFGEWLVGYDEAFSAKDLEKLASFYHPDVTIFEGGGVNRGWADYRDHHLGPELEEFENLKFEHTAVKARALGDASAYVTAEYHLATQYRDRNIDVTGLATLILVKSENGDWKIRHSHTSRRPRQAQ